VSERANAEEAEEGEGTDREEERRRKSMRSAGANGTSGADRIPAVLTFFSPPYARVSGLTEHKLECQLPF
jgi:hypothetical protein